MTKIELVVPDRLSKIDPELRERLLVGAIREVASVELKEKEEELEEALKNTINSTRTWSNGPSGTMHTTKHTSW